MWTCQATGKARRFFAASVGLAGLWIGNSPLDDEAGVSHAARQDAAERMWRCHTPMPPACCRHVSWRKMLSELGEAFRRGSSVDEPVRMALLKDLEDMAADGAFADMRMRRIAGCAPVNLAPQRITETAYFKFHARRGDEELPGGARPSAAQPIASPATRAPNEGSTGKGSTDSQVSSRRKEAPARLGRRFFSGSPFALRSRLLPAQCRDADHAQR